MCLFRRRESDDHDHHTSYDPVGEKVSRISIREITDPEEQKLASVVRDFYSEKPQLGRQLIRELCTPNESDGFMRTFLAVNADRDSGSLIQGFAILSLLPETLSLMQRSGLRYRKMARGVNTNKVLIGIGMSPELRNFVHELFRVLR